MDGESHSEYWDEVSRHWDTAEQAVTTRRSPKTKVRTSSFRSFLTRVLGSEMPIVITGERGAGKTELYRALTGALPMRQEGLSEGREEMRAAVDTGRKRIRSTFHVLPGQDSDPNGKELEDLFSQGRAPRGLIHVVTAGHDQIWEESQRLLVEAALLRERGRRQAEIDALEAAREAAALAEAEAEAARIGAEAAAEDARAKGAAATEAAQVKAEAKATRIAAESEATRIEARAGATRAKAETAAGPGRARAETAAEKARAKASAAAAAERAEAETAAEASRVAAEAAAQVALRITAAQNAARLAAEKAARFTTAHAEQLAGLRDRQAKPLSWHLREDQKLAEMKRFRLLWRDHLRGAWSRLPTEGRPIWLIIAVTKCDLWFNDREAVKRYYIPSAQAPDSQFGTELRGFVAEIGASRLRRLAVLPVASYPQPRRLTAALGEQLPTLGKQETDSLLNHFRNVVGDFCDDREQ